MNWRARARLRFIDDQIAAVKAEQRRVHRDIKTARKRIRKKRKGKGKLRADEGQEG